MSLSISKDAYYGRFLIQKELEKSIFDPVFIALVEFMDYTEDCGYQKYAIMKQYPESELNKRIENEARILKIVGDLHPNIAKIYHHMLIHRKLTIFMEFWYKCSLGYKINDKTANGKFYSEFCLLEHFLAIAHVLAVLHNKNFAHRDLKPDNIFESDDGTWKLGEFGGAKMNVHINNVNTLNGSKNYMSPLMLKQSEEGVKKSSAIDPKKEDVYSLGKTFYEIATINLDCQFKEDESENKDDISMKMAHLNYSQGFINIIIEMVNYEANNRPSMKEVYRKIKQLLVPNSATFPNHLESLNSMEEEEKGFAHEGPDFISELPSSESLESLRIGNYKNCGELTSGEDFDGLELLFQSIQTPDSEIDNISDTNMESTEPSDNMNTVFCNPDAGFEESVWIDDNAASVISLSSFEPDSCPIELPSNYYVAEAPKYNIVKCDCGAEIDTNSVKFEACWKECLEIAQPFSCWNCRKPWYNFGF